MNRRWRSFHKRVYSDAQKWYELNLDYNSFYLTAAVTKAEKEALASVIAGDYRIGTKLTAAPWFEVIEHA